MHGILQGKLVGFIFTPKRFVELSVMRWNAADQVFGILACHGILWNPAAFAFSLKRFTANETVLV